MRLKPLTYAKIDLDNLKENHETVRDLVGADVKIMSIIKADGYGHGAVKVAKALAEAGTDCFGVASFSEALQIRIRSGVKNDIYVLSGSDEYSFKDIIKYRFIPVIYDLKSLKALNDEANRANKTVKAHLKFDTSMGRLGFFPKEAVQVFKTALSLENIEIDGIMSHFSSADEKDSNYSKGQLIKFNEILLQAKEMKINPAFKHIANSAGIINIKESHYNMVRPGIMLFGSAPSKKMSKNIPLKEVMSVHSRIIQIKEFPIGSCISYSRTFTTKKRSNIAVIPVGYADGFRRRLSNKGRVLVHGKKAPVTGNVTMDLTMIDVTRIPEAKVGDTVTLLGTDGDTSISAWDLAEALDTISYEILTGISKRVKRRY